MTSRLSASELILNEDGSVYHLHLLAEHVAPTVITVGDQERAKRISLLFDTVEYEIGHREFVTYTGVYNGKRLTVCSTGIGTDNVDIFLNELDAAVNIDLENRKIKEKLTSLNIIRIGTSGAIQADIPVGSYVTSLSAVSTDALPYHYAYPFDQTEKKLTAALQDHLQWSKHLPSPCIIKGSEELISIVGQDMISGITSTATGFYAPQGRALRLTPHNVKLVDRLADFQYQRHRITNLEMETSGLYSLSNLLGHRCCSCSAILANRANGTFSDNPKKVVDGLIANVLNTIASNDYFQ